MFATAAGRVCGVVRISGVQVARRRRRWRRKTPPLASHLDPIEALLDLDTLHDPAVGEGRFPHPRPIQRHLRRWVMVVVMVVMVVVW